MDGQQTDPSPAPSDLLALDRLLQRWRIRMAGRYIGSAARVLDVGCADGSLFAQLTTITSGYGIDPSATDTVVRDIPIRRGRFPADLPETEHFDVVTALAVFEHVTPEGQAAFVDACREALVPHGRVVMTVPSPIVDHLIRALQSLRLLRGMETGQHWGFRPLDAPPLFREHGFELTVHRRFQLGLNHLFVFTAR